MYVAEVAPAIGLAVTPVFPAYHWKVGEVPEAATVKVVVPPLLIVVEAAGCVVMAGATAIVTVAVVESAVPRPLVARTQ